MEFLSLLADKHSPPNRILAQEPLVLLPRGLKELPHWPNAILVTLSASALGKNNSHFTFHCFSGLSSQSVIPVFYET